LKDSRADGVWLAASLLYRGDDKRRLALLHHIAAKAKVPLLATNEVLLPRSRTPPAAGCADLHQREDDDRRHRQAA